MRVCLVNLWHTHDDPDAHVEADVTRRGFATALAARGHEVHVVQELGVRAEVVRDGVTWHFVPPTVATRLTRRVVGLARRHPMVPTPAPGIVPAIERLRPEVIHTFDLVFYPTLILLGRLARRLGAALVAHYHGGDPATSAPGREIERRALAEVDLALFTTREHAARFPIERVATLAETSTFFGPGDRAEARARTGLAGDPAILCPGRLDPVKDPRTTLAGFARVRAARPDARLFLAYTDDTLGLPTPPGVTRLGRVPHAEMEHLFRAADLMVQSSVREVCGVAVLEALACGCPPVVTDIPSFRWLVDGAGALFPVGAAEALAGAVLSLAPAVSPRARFEAELSFAALAARLEGHYAEAIRGRASRSG
ncbi:MAG: glycosyltransferase family 4 protein [Myxococcota bacterium]